MNILITKTFTVALESGKKVTAEMEIDITYDKHYGADADGNGAFGSIEVNDVYPTVPMCDEAWRFSDEGAYLTQDEKDEALDKLKDKAYNSDYDLE